MQKSNRQDAIVVIFLLSFSSFDKKSETDPINPEQYGLQIHRGYESGER